MKDSVLCNSSFHLKVFTSAEDESFVSVFNLYKRIFTDPDESEDMFGIREGLALNFSARWQGEFGPFKEYWVGCFLKDSCVGGVNFAVFSLCDGKRSAHINYIFTEPQYRRMGVALQLLESIKEISGADYIFCEMNDPAKMSPSQLLADEKTSGITTRQRLVWWQRRGFRKLEFNYVQPALDSSKRPCTHLSLFILEFDSLIYAQSLYLHLLKFYHVCVLKCKFKGSWDIRTMRLVKREMKEYLESFSFSDKVMPSLP